MWQIWIFLQFCWHVSSTIAHTRCSQPDIKHPRTPLLVYQITAPINVTVYHCFFKEEFTCDRDVCSHCPFATGSSDFTVFVKSSRQYSVVTRNCLNSFSTNTFMDDGRSYHVSVPSSSFYKCGNNAKLKKTVTVTLAKYNVTVDLVKGTIVLKSGTVCRYSLGFCHDNLEGIDVAWNMEGGDQYTCSGLRKINVSNTYQFILNNKNYAIIESRGKYFALELKNKQRVCGVTTWNTQQQELIVTEGYMTKTNFSLKETDQLKFSFRSKQDLYDFLVEKCIDDLKDTDFTDKYDGLLEKITLRDQVERLKSQFQITLYLSIISVPCVVGLVIYFTYSACKKMYNVFKCKPTSSCISKLENKDDSSIYEYI